MRFSANAAVSVPVMLCIAGGVVGSFLLARVASPADLPGNPGMPFAYAIAALLFILPNLIAAAAANRGGGGGFAPLAAIFLLAFAAALGLELIALDRIVGIESSALIDPVAVAMSVANCAILLLLALRRGRAAHA